MKRYALGSIVVFGVAFFGFQTNGEELFQDGFPSGVYSTSTAKCINIKNSTDGLEDCDYAFTGATRDRFIEQDLTFLQSQLPISISKIQLYQGGITPGGGVGDVIDLVLLDQNKTGVATSSVAMHIGGTASELTFTFGTPYSVTNQTDITGFRLHMNAGTTNPAPVLRVSENLFPPIGGFNSVYDLNSGTFPNFNSANTEYDTYDLWTRVYIDDPNVLRITSPANGSLLTTTPVVISGTCFDDFALDVYNGLTVASSTEAYSSWVQCSPVFGFGAGVTVSEGSWTAYAYSSSTSDTVTFFYSPDYGGFIGTTTPTYNPIAGWSCNIPYLNFDACAVIATSIDRIASTIAVFFRAVLTGVTSIPPFNWLSDIKDAIDTGISTATTTTDIVPLTVTIPTSTMGTAAPFTMQLFTHAQFTDVVPQDTWDDLRPYFNMAVYLLFGMYLFYRILHAV